MTTSEASPVPVGYVRRAHGIAGAVLVHPLTDVPETRYARGAVLGTDAGFLQRLTVGDVRPHNEGLLVSFDEVTDRDTAEALVGTTLTIDPRDRRALGDGEFWDEDLVGLDVLDLEGVALGTVSDVVHGTAQDRLVVTTPQGSIVEVPFVEAIVPEIRAGDGVVIVDPPKGLF